MSATGEQIPEVEVVEEIHGAEVAAPATGAALAVAAPVQASDLVERMEKIKEAMDRAMKPNVDFGVIPGTNKPTLLKPGAEKLAVMFKLDVQTTHDERVGPGDHLTVPAYTMVYDAPTGIRLGRGEGLCTTRERKYAYRKQERTCPHCGVAAVIKGKAEYGGGWLCFTKKGGCNAKWPDGDQAIEGQETGEIENPDLPDLWNTVIKMARKRAFVDAVLLVTGASALFTQDVEDAAQAAEPVAAADPYGAVAQGPLIQNATEALAYTLGSHPGADEVKAVLKGLNQDAGYLSWVACKAVTRVAQAIFDAREARKNTPPATTNKAESVVAPGEGDPAVETDDERQEREKPEAIAAEHGAQA